MATQTLPRITEAPTDEQLRTFLQWRFRNPAGIDLDTDDGGSRRESVVRHMNLEEMHGGYVA